ncbi:MAG: universal stress protein [Flavobacteriales bacterium]|nr:universal stress protein [Flavobacteriales bacterium]MCX7769293.1 universal stress protein [Flavobacteriales bacterium]MDW8410549.1 universal stress protein [Flavobacteriales bacterium]
MELNFDITHILLPTDFSTTADVALRHAGNLAKLFNARLTILNVREAFAEHVVLQRYGLKGHEDKEYFEHVMVPLQERASLVENEFGIKAEIVCKSGSIPSEVNKFVKENKVSDIVIGMHGLKGRDSYFMGGNAYKIVNSTKVPVLQVEEGATQLEYKTIVMPLDSSFHTREKVPYVSLLAQKFGSLVKIPALLTSSSEETRTNLLKILHQVEQYLNTRNIRTESELISTNNLARETLNYAEKNHADLIVIMSEQEVSLKGLFLGPYAQQIVQQSRIPVFTIPPKVEMLVSRVSV